MIDSFDQVAPLLVSAIALIAGILIMRPVTARYDLRNFQMAAIAVVFALFIFGSIITQNAISGLVTAGINWNMARYAVLIVMGLVAGCSLAMGMTKR